MAGGLTWRRRTAQAASSAMSRRCSVISAKTLWQNQFLPQRFCPNTKALPGCHWCDDVISCVILATWPGPSSLSWQVSAGQLIGGWGSWPGSGGLWGIPATNLSVVAFYHIKDPYRAALPTIPGSHLSRRATLTAKRNEDQPAGSCSIYFIMSVVEIHHPSYRPTGMP